MGSKLSGALRDSTGAALASGTITVHRAGTSSLAALYSSAALLAANVKANPFTADEDGRFSFFVPPGAYKLTGEKEGFDNWVEDYIVAASLPRAFDIRDYGAAVDGVTDDTVAVQAAVTAAGAVGGAVFIPPGQTNITATIVLLDNVTIFGAGYASRVHMVTADTQMFLCQSVDKCAFFNFRLTGQGGFTTPGLGAIRLGLGSAGNGTLDSWCSGLWLEGVSNCGITIGSKSERCRVLNCVIDGAGEEGIYLLGEDCIISGSVLMNSGNAGIKVSGATETHNIIANNFASYNRQQGILLSGTSSGGVTSGNVCAYNDFDGIRVAENMTDHGIVGNVCIGNGQSADNTRDNINLNGAGVARIYIDGNTCRQGSLANKSRDGLRITTAVDCIVGDNDLRNGGKTGQYTNTGTNTQGVTLSPREVPCSGNLAVTSTTPADVPGCSIAVTPLLNQKTMVLATVDTTRGVAGASLLVTCVVNGVAQPGALVLTDSGRQMISGFWAVSLTGGTAYTIKLQAALTVGAGPDFTITAASTKIGLVATGQT